MITPSDSRLVDLGSPRYRNGARNRTEFLRGFSTALKSVIIAILGFLLLASGSALSVLPSTGSPNFSPAPSTSQIGVYFNLTTENLRFVPDEFRVPANATVYVRLTQQDSVDHTFTLSPEKDFVLPSTWSSSEVDAYFAAGNNLTDVRLPAVVDAVAWANFTTPAEPGRYEFVCRFPGHFQSGMFGFMVVELREAFVNLTTEGFRFSPDTFTVPPGAIVHARITQRDRAPHTFTVGVEKDRVLPGDWTPSELDAYFAAGNNLTDEFIPAVVETSVFANFTAPLEPGRYEFVCRIAGHFQGGMIGFMIVSEGPPTSRGGPPLGLIPSIMLLALGSVMGFAAIYHVRAVRAAKRRE